MPDWGRRERRLCGSALKVVEEQRPKDSASSSSLDRAALEALPERSADDLLRAMPGLHLGGPEPAVAKRATQCARRV